MTKRSMQVVATLVVVGVVHLLTTTFVVSTVNAEVRLRNVIAAKQRDNQSEYDSLWKKISRPSLPPPRCEGDNISDVRIPGFSLALSSKSPLSGRSVMAFDEPPESAAVHPYPTGLSEEDLVVLVAADAAADLADARAAYPEEPPRNWRRSRRLLGDATEDSSIAAWDQFDADLYPAVGVNLLAIGSDGDSTPAHYQEAAWRGGKRNDLVLTSARSRSHRPPSSRRIFAGTAADRSRPRPALRA